MPNMYHLFSHLILLANHEDKKWQGMTIKRGQLITGRKILSEETGISEQSIRTCIERLKSTSEITIKSTNKYSIITICNYEEYQPSNADVNQQINQQSNQQLTNNQPATNHKQEYKNIKKEKNKEEKEEVKEEKGDSFDPNLLIPMNDEEFIPKDTTEEYWEKWKKYKKEEFNFRYKSAVSEQAAKTELINLSGNDAEIAMKIIDQSIANGWKGFFKLKNNHNGKSDKQQGLSKSQIGKIFVKHVTTNH